MLLKKKIRHKLRDTGFRSQRAYRRKIFMSFHITIQTPGFHEYQQTINSELPPLA